MLFPMSLRWSSYVASKSQKGGSKTQKSRFPSKIVLRLKKVCYKVFFCANCQRQSCKAFIVLTNHAKMTNGGDPFYLKFWVKLTPSLERNRRFRSIFACSASAITLSEKVQLTLKSSPLCAFQWAQDKHHTLSLSPLKGGSKKQSIQNLNNKLW